MPGTKKENHWIPLADLMTVLMVIFLFISISFMAQVKKEQQKRDKIFQEYKKTKLLLFKELNSAFKDDFKKWNLKLDQDLSMKFTNPQVLFGEGSSDINLRFQNILTAFIPKYLSVVLNEKYKDKIAEIRIEGHTDTKPIKRTSDPYIDNMILSQDRARNVLAFLRIQNSFINLRPKDKLRLQYLLTANGLSYGRTVDKEYKISFESKQPIDNSKSRRVEFRIVTTSDATINKALKNIE
jgi:outer membrane protein OmpA-like peptidoglycan-associated protein